LVAVLAIYYLLPFFFFFFFFLASFLADSQPSKASLLSPLLTTHLKRKRAKKSKNQKNYIGISSKQTTADNKAREEELLLLLLPLLSRMIHSQEGLVTYLTSAIDPRLGITIVCINPPGFNPNTKESCRLRQAAKPWTCTARNPAAAATKKSRARKGNCGGGACMGMHRHSSYAPAKTSPLFWERHREPISNVINSKQARPLLAGSGSKEPSPNIKLRLQILFFFFWAEIENLAIFKKSKISRIYTRIFF
jgi:hypothetical protein